MPRFDYHCKECGYETEQRVERHDDSVDCPICHNPLEKKISRFNILGSKDSSQREVPSQLETPLGVFSHVAEIPVPEEFPEIIEAHLYQKVPEKGDPSMN